MTIEITEATIDDVIGISEVQKETWLATFPNEKYGITIEDILSEDFFSRDRIEKRKMIISDPDSNTKFWVAKNNNQVVGYCCAKKLDEKLGFIKGPILTKNPDGPFISGKKVPEMEMSKI